MKIKLLHLENFKRFTDLKIDLSQQGKELPKLVLLIGANGSGKSAVFDAFEFVWNVLNTQTYDTKDIIGYYLKKNGSDNGSINIGFSSSNKILSKAEESLSMRYSKDKELEFGAYKHESRKSVVDSDLFYGRSAIRYLPRIEVFTIGKPIKLEENNDRPRFYIDPDNRFENDIDIIVKGVLDQALAGYYDNDKDEFGKIRKFLERIETALPRIFGNEGSTSLKFIKPVSPADGLPVELIFQKGESEQISYNLLSSGEKEVINILFNLFVRTPFYQDSIYFFDELDAHLHTALQFDLLKEIVENWIPDNCQIWTATHSLGFIQYAKESNEAVIIDFDHYDFDKKIELKPEIKTPEVFDIAVPKEALSILFKDKKLVFSENENAFFYNSMGLEETIFLGAFDKSSIFLRIEQDNNSFGLIDRDYLNDDEVIKLKQKYNNLLILNYYCFENYLYHPANLKSLQENFNTDAYIESIKAEKNKQLSSIKRKLDNDRKSYIFFKKDILKLSNPEHEKMVKLLESDDFEDFYKVFSMKGRGGLSGIQNLRKEELVKTNWFKTHITDILVNK